MTTGSSHFPWPVTESSRSFYDIRPIELLLIEPIPYGSNSCFGTGGTGCPSSHSIKLLQRRYASSGSRGLSLIYREISFSISRRVVSYVVTIPFTYCSEVTFVLYYTTVLHDFKQCINENPRPSGVEQLNPHPTDEDLRQLRHIPSLK